MGYSPWGPKELDTTERLTLSLFIFFFKCCDWCPYERKEMGIARDRVIPVKDHVNLEAETGIMLPQAKQHLALPEAERGEKKSSPEHQRVWP